MATIAELLGDAGYFTCMTGKWHLGKNPGHRPEDRGFQRVFSFLGGGVSHFNDVQPLSDSEIPHTLYDLDGKDVTHDLPDDFYSTYWYTDKTIEFLKDKPKGQPFFSYVAFTAPRDPLQVPDDWIERYRGKYDGGYLDIKEARTRRMKELGLIRQDMEINPGSGQFPAWDDMTAEEQRAKARKMEIYAGMVELLDQGLGKITDYLKSTGEYDNTIFLFMSDNGANPKEPGFYSRISQEEVDKRFDNSMDHMGKVGSFVSMGGAWAETANTPLSYFKLTTAEGGVRLPLLVEGPGVQRTGIIHDQLMHMADILPTFLDYAGVERPATRKGYELAPPYGKNEWHLYNLKNDPQEQTNLSKVHPDKFAEMKAEWEAYAKAVGYIEATGDTVLQHMSAEEFFTRYGEAVAG